MHMQKFLVLMAAAMATAHPALRRGTDGTGVAPTETVPAPMVCGALAART
jgi:hypothetical protein